MIVRITNAVLATCCLIFLLAFGWIPLGAIDTSANETFASVVKQLDGKGSTPSHPEQPMDRSPPLDGEGLGEGYSAEDTDEYADGCLIEYPEDWSE